MSRSIAPEKATVKASWPDSAFVMNDWVITASLSEDGKLSYSNGIHTVTEYDESGESRLISEITDESGAFSISSEGELSWSNYSTDYDEDSMFIRTDGR